MKTRWKLRGCVAESDIQLLLSETNDTTKISSRQIRSGEIRAGQVGSPQVRLS
jgi:hypothetical protein